MRSAVGGGRGLQLRDDSGQHAHISKLIEETGRLLGGWIKQSRL